MSFYNSHFTLSRIFVFCSIPSLCRVTHTMKRPFCVRFTPGRESWLSNWFLSEMWYENWSRLGSLTSSVTFVETGDDTMEESAWNELCGWSHRQTNSPGGEPDGFDWHVRFTVSPSLTIMESMIFPSEDRITGAPGGAKVKKLFKALYDYVNHFCAIKQSQIVLQIRIGI